MMSDSMLLADNVPSLPSWPPTMLRPDGVACGVSVPWPATAVMINGLLLAFASDRVMPESVVVFCSKTETDSALRLLTTKSAEPLPSRSALVTATGVSPVAVVCPAPNAQ